MRSRRFAIIAATVSAGAMLLGACNGGGELGGTEAPDGDEFPSETITLIAASSPGGGLDTTTRRLEPGLSDALGVPIAVENHPGSGTALAANYLLQSLEPDCHSLIVTGHPALYTAPEIFDVDVSYRDLASVGIPASNPGVWRVRNDAPWETIEELVADARQRPGEISMSSSSASLTSYSLGVLEVMEAMDVEFNIVPFADGGSAARNALVRGEVDFTMAGAFASLPIAEDTRVIAVHEEENRWPDITDNAPTVSEALGEEIPTADGFYALETHGECRENHPDRFAQLEEAYRATVFSDEYQQQLRDLGEEGTVVDLSPDEIRAVADDYSSRMMEAVERYAHLFE